MKREMNTLTTEGQQLVDTISAGNTEEARNLIKQGAPLSGYYEMPIPLEDIGDCGSHNIDTDATDIESNTNVDIRLRYTVTILSHAALKNNTEIVHLLLEAGISPSHGKDQLALIWALRSSANKDMIELLLSHGANADVQEEHTGNTPLLIAIRKHRTDAVDLLLKAGASTWLYNSAHEMPLTLAIQGNFEEIIPRLLEFHVPVLGTSVRVFTVKLCAREVIDNEIRYLLYRRYIEESISEQENDHTFQKSFELEDKKCYVIRSIASLVAQESPSDVKWCINQLPKADKCKRAVEVFKILMNTIINKNFDRTLEHIFQAEWDIIKHLDVNTPIVSSVMRYLIDSTRFQNIIKHLLHTPVAEKYLLALWYGYIRIREWRLGIGDIINNTSIAGLVQANLDVSQKELLDRIFGIWIPGKYLISHSLREASLGFVQMLYAAGLEYDNLNQALQSVTTWKVPEDARDKIAYDETIRTEDFQVTVLWAMSFLESPRSLADICRIQIRRSLEPWPFLRIPSSSEFQSSSSAFGLDRLSGSACLLVTVQQLPLPDTLKDFLMLREFPNTFL